MPAMVASELGAWSATNPEFAGLTEAGLMNWHGGSPPASGRAARHSAGSGAAERSGVFNRGLRGQRQVRRPPKDGRPAPELEKADRERSESIRQLDRSGKTACGPKARIWYLAAWVSTLALSRCLTCALSCRRQRDDTRGHGRMSEATCARVGRPAVGGQLERWVRRRC